MGVGVVVAPEIACDNSHAILIIELGIHILWWFFFSQIFRFASIGRAIMFILIRLHFGTKGKANRLAITKIKF